MEEWLTSVGIDLGTSTTKWLFSRLKATRTFQASSLPRYEITQSEITHVSAVYTTPLLDAETIDVPAVVALLEAGYRSAGLLPGQVQTGAVLITGETATKRNAEELTHALARHAGALVAAAAGAELESLLAGKGSGARRRSQEREGIVANVDIGGGTANTAYFLGGRVVATATFHVGGRLIRLEESGRVSYAAPALKKWSSASAAAGIPPLPAEGTRTSFPELQTFCQAMAETLLRCVCGDPEALLQAKPLIVGAAIAELPCPAEIWISGGVGSLMNEPSPTSVAETAKFGDIGPLLAACIARSAAACPVPLRVADQTVRATVIGAGTQTAELSGATLYCSPGALPLRNVPVVICEWPPEAVDAGTEVRLATDAAAAAVVRGLALYGKQAEPPFALGLRSPDYVSYRRLTRFADAVIAAYASAGLRDELMLLVCDGDFAKSLGNNLFGKLGEPWRRKLVCIDQLLPQEGDYLDVGEPVKEDIVPVVIKSLVFGG